MRRWPTLIATTTNRKDGKQFWGRSLNTKKENLLVDPVLLDLRHYRVSLCRYPPISPARPMHWESPTLSVRPSVGRHLPLVPGDGIEKKLPVNWILFT